MLKDISVFYIRVENSSYVFVLFPRLPTPRLAVKSALSDKVNNSELYVLEEITLAAPKTKEVLNIINSFNVGDAKVLFITEGDVNVERSARNIQGVKALACEGMNIFDLLHYDKLFITKGAVAKIEEVLG